MADSDNPTDAWLRKVTERFGRIKFPPGVIGKSTYIMIALLVLWAIIAFRIPINASWRNPLFLIGIIPTLVAIWLIRSNQRFAERNPGQAMLEGAQFLDYYKFEAQAKGHLLPPSPMTTDPDRPPPSPRVLDDGADE